MDIWTPVEDEMLRLIPEPTNSVDGNAVAVMKEQVVGHVPFNLSPIISLFLPYIDKLREVTDSLKTSGLV